MSDLTVKVEEGKLKGKLYKTTNDKEYYGFKGIPYAKPPVGELRFSVPVSPEPWKGVRDAMVDCSICAQFDRQTNTVIGDEDCLFLNVFTPKVPESGVVSLPVMVFIHGGGFVFGSGTDDAIHSPEYLVEKDAVVVSINYRLGVLGFLTLNCKEAPGNMGLRDQVQALKWIQKNITNFNGDPKNVTIFGISAGGASVEYLLLSPMAKGLFHKAVAQSGSSLLHWAHSNKVKELSNMLPVVDGKSEMNNEQLLKYLKKIPTYQLIKLSMTAITTEKFRGGINFGFVPTIEKPGDWEPFLDKSPYQLLDKGEFTKVPVITGFCSREGLLMDGFGKDILEQLVKEKNFIDYLPFKIDSAQDSEINKKLIALYVEQNGKFNEPDGFGIDFFTDVDFFGGIYVATSLIARNHAPVYFYEFSYDGKLNYLKTKLNLKRKGACHGDDGGYLIKSKILPDDISDTDKLVRERMVRMWSNFAKQGDPTPILDNIVTTKWEAIAETGMSCLLIDENLSMQHNVYSDRAKLFLELFKKFSAFK